jgi:RNA polymerase sigma factor for flagellar operon FliA
MRDYLRRQDPLSRSERRAYKAALLTQEEMEQETKAPVSLEDAALKLPLTLRRRFKIPQPPVELDSQVWQDTDDDNDDRSRGDTAVADANPSPREESMIASDHALVRKMVIQLPPRQQYVIEEYYFAGRMLSAIAEMLGVTESRVCQIKREAERNLALFLKKSLTR